MTVSVWAPVALHKEVANTWLCNQDLAVVVRPAPDRLAIINDDLANWTIQDARRVELPPANERLFHLSLRPRPVKVGPRDVLIAVIHGHGATGWRNPQARQTYLLEHVGGEHLRPVSFRRLRLRLPAGVPPLTGEVLLETISACKSHLC